MSCYAVEEIKEVDKVNEKICLYIRERYASEPGMTLERLYAEEGYKKLSQEYSRLSRIYEQKELEGYLADRNIQPTLTAMGVIMHG